MLERAWIASDFDIAKAVKGKARLEDLETIASEGITVGLTGAAKVVGVDAARRLENFGEAHLNRCSHRALNLEPHPACNVLTEINDQTAWTVLSDRNGFDGFKGADWFGTLRHQANLISSLYCWLLPVCIVKRWHVPARNLESRIVVLAVIQVAVQDCGGGGTP